jgi:hypothetical protein
LSKRNVDRKSNNLADKLPTQYHFVPPDGRPTSRQEFRDHDALRLAVSSGKGLLPPNVALLAPHRSDVAKTRAKSRVMPGWTRFFAVAASDALGGAPAWESAIAVDQHAEVPYDFAP